MKNQPRLDKVILRGAIIDISEKAISKALFGDNFELTSKTPEYDYQMNELKKVKQLSTED